MGTKFKITAAEVVYDPLGVSLTLETNRGRHFKVRHPEMMGARVDVFQKVKDYCEDDKCAYVEHLGIDCNGFPINPKIILIDNLY